MDEMVPHTQTCSLSKQGEGMTFYIKKRLAHTIAEYFPYSKDAEFDYRAKFNPESETLEITKDISHET